MKLFLLALSTLIPSLVRGEGKGLRGLQEDEKLGPNDSETLKCHLHPWTCSPCFSDTSTVEVYGKGLVEMKDLSFGDQILTAGGEFKPVYTFGHKNPTKRTTFLKIQTADSEHPLEISPKHLVFLDSGFNPIAAENVRRGDILRGATKGKRVTSVTTIEKEGIYAPFTTDGTLVVDGVVASSYISLESLEEHPLWKNWVVSISHLGVSPLRLMCTKISNKPCQTLNDDGVPHYLAYLFKLFGQKTKHATIVVTFAYVLLSMATMALEYAMSLKGTTLVVCGAATWFACKGKKVV